MGKKLTITISKSQPDTVKPITDIISDGKA